MTRSWAWTFTAILAAALTACSNGREAFKDQARKLTLNGPVEGSAVTEEASTDWSLQTTRRLDVKACLVEQAMMRSVGARDWIVSGTGIDTTGKSSENGCLTWTEHVAFAPGARPSYIPLTRFVRPVDGHFEGLKIDFAINPWSGLNGSEPAVVDPATVTVTNLATADTASSALAGLQSPGKLSVSHLDHALVMQPSAKLRLRFHPEVKTTTMAGAETILPVESGRLEVRAQLAYRPSPGAALEPLHTEVTKRDLKFTNGVVDIQDMPITGLRAVDKTKGTYHLLLSLRPVKGPADLRAFEGVLDLGDWTNLSGGTAANTDQERQEVSVTPIATRPAGRGFKVGILGGATSGPLDENTVYRRIQISIHAPVYGETLGESLEGEKFLISAMDNPSMIFEETVVNGALDWQDAVVHNYYKPMNERIEKQIWFTRVKTGEKTMKTVLLTPGVRFLIVIVDADQGNSPESVPAEALKNATLRHPQIRLESPCVTVADPTYNVDPGNLDLNVRFISNFQFTPTVRRFDEPFWGMGTFDGPGLRAGYYLLTVAVFNMDLKDFSKPVAITQRIVLHTGNNLTTQLSLLTRDLSFTRVRNYAVARIDFLDPETLEDAEGRKLDPFTAFRDGLPVSRGQIMKDLKVEFPLNIFPYVISNDSCAASQIAGNNIQNPELQKFAKDLAESKVDLLALAQEKPPVTPVDRDAWLGAAQAWGLTPVEIKSPVSARALGYSEDVQPLEVEQALECAYQASEGNQQNPAKCLYDGRHPFQRLCQAVAVKWFEMLDRAQTEKLGDARMRREYVVTHTFLANCTKETKEYFRVRKYLQVNEMAGTESVRVHGAVPLSVSIRKAFYLGTDTGTEYMHEDLNRLAVSVKGSGPFSGLVQGLLGIFVARPAGVNLTPPDLTAEQKAKLVGSGTANAKATKALDSFRWIFNYQIPYVMAGLVSNASLTLESSYAELDVRAYRTCYTVEALLNDEQWEGLMLAMKPTEAPVPRFLVCFPERREKIAVKERYYYVYSEPEAPGTLIDNARVKNRWMLSFRGERDFGVFMHALRPHVGVIYRDSNQAMEPVNGYIDRLRAAPLMDKTTYPGMMSAPIPDAKHYDSVYNLEGWFPKFWRFIVGETPFEDHGAPIQLDQNSPKERQFFDYH